MKFSNGCWLLKEGFECFSPQQVYFTKFEERKVTLCTPTHRINQRGDTLGGINLTLIITSPAPEIIRVQTWHHMGILKKTPEFELELTDAIPLDISDSDDLLSIKSGSLSLEIEKKNWSMAYKRNGKVISKSCPGDLALMKTSWKGSAYDKGDIENTYIRQQLSIGVGELIYGTGERFTPFVKNGQSIDIWNADGGTSTEQSYKNIPFYLSNTGYGILVNHPENVSFEIATEQVTKAEFSV
ncbi:MAG: alpha-xylosidase, partial [Eubacterium sp.]|nr:alpha-xylosidase [Eubacterium sp.]